MARKYSGETGFSDLKWGDEDWSDAQPTEAGGWKHSNFRKWLGPGAGKNKIKKAAAALMNIRGGFADLGGREGTFEGGPGKGKLGATSVRGIARGDILNVPSTYKFARGKREEDVQGALSDLAQRRAGYSAAQTGTETARGELAGLTEGLGTFPTQFQEAAQPVAEKIQSARNLYGVAQEQQAALEGAQTAEQALAGDVYSFFGGTGEEGMFGEDSEYGTPELPGGQTQYEQLQNSLAEALSGVGLGISGGLQAYGASAEDFGQAPGFTMVTDPESANFGQMVASGSEGLLPPFAGEAEYDAGPYKLFYDTNQDSPTYGMIMDIEMAPGVSSGQYQSVFDALEKQNENWQQQQQDLETAAGLSEEGYQRQKRAIDLQKLDQRAALRAALQGAQAGRMGTEAGYQRELGRSGLAYSAPLQRKRQIEQAAEQQGLQDTLRGIRGGRENLQEQLSALATQREAERTGELEAEERLAQERESYLGTSFAPTVEGMQTQQQNAYNALVNLIGPEAAQQYLGEGGTPGSPYQGDPQEVNMDAWNALIQGYSDDPMSALADIYGEDPNYADPESWIAGDAPSLEITPPAGSGQIGTNIASAISGPQAQLADMQGQYLSTLDALEGAQAATAGAQTAVDQFGTTAVPTALADVATERGKMMDVLAGPQGYGAQVGQDVYTEGGQIPKIDPATGQQETDAQGNPVFMDLPSAPTEAGFTEQDAWSDMPGTTEWAPEGVLEGYDIDLPEGFDEIGGLSDFAIPTGYANIPTASQIQQTGQAPLAGLQSQLASAEEQEAAALGQLVDARRGIAGTTSGINPENIALLKESQFDQPLSQAISTALSGAAMPLADIQAGRTALAGVPEPTRGALSAIKRKDVDNIAERGGEQGYTTRGGVLEYAFPEVFGQFSGTRGHIGGSRVAGGRSAWVPASAIEPTFGTRQSIPDWSGGTGTYGSAVPLGGAGTADASVIESVPLSGEELIGDLITYAQSQSPEAYTPSQEAIAEYQAITGMDDPGFDAEEGWY